MPWYVVCERIDEVDLDDPIELRKIWTVSRDPKACGWNTDSGQNGYGLTKADAQFLCDAANEKERQALGLKIKSPASDGVALTNIEHPDWYNGWRA